MFIVRPMIWRELLRESRHRTHFAGRALIAAALGVIVLAVGLSLGGAALRPSGAVFYPGMGPAWQYSYLGPTGPSIALMPMPAPPAASTVMQANMARLGTELFTIWAIGQYIALCALATIRAASLAEERRRDRLPLLTMTALGVRGAVLGTYASILVRALFTMLLLLPILALARGFGGFTTEQVCVAAGIAFVAAANAAALTLALASLVSGTAAAVVLSAVVQAIILAIVGDWDPGVGGGPVHSFRMITLLVQGMVQRWDVMAYFALKRVILSACFLRLAMGLMQRPAADPGRHLKRALAAMDRFFLSFESGGKWVLWKSGLGECRGNPIYWRERAISVVGQRDHMIRILYGSGVLLSVVLTAVLVFGWTRSGNTMATLGVVGVPLLIAGLLMLVQPALAFAREKERGGLAALVLTPMTPGQFVMGKYLYALRSIAVPLCIGLVFALLLSGSAFDYDYKLGVGWFVAVILMVPLVVAMILYVSAGAQSSAGGIFGGIAALGGLALVLLHFYEFVRTMGRPGYGGFALSDHDSFILGLWSRYNSFGHQGASFLLLLCSFLTAPYSRWMRNGLVIAMFVLLPVVLGNIARELLPASMILAIPLALAVYMGIRLKMLHVALVPIVAALICPTGAALTIVLIPVFLLLAYWRAARYADSGVFNRAFVAVALVGIVANFLAFAITATQSALTAPLILLVAGGICAFLHFTIRQFNQLVERNG